MPTIAVLLAGCGVKDGSEIHESVLTLLSLNQKGARYACVAPDLDQRETVNHLTGKPTGETRNMLVESARIARGNIKALSDVSASDFDGLIIPGGSGALINFVRQSAAGSQEEVIPQVAHFIREMLDAKKPVGAICIAPKTVAMAIADRHPEVTIGKDKKTAASIEAFGGIHKTCTVDMIHVDEKNGVITTPAYMLGPGLKDIFAGIDRLVSAVLERCKGA